MCVCPPLCIDFIYLSLFSFSSVSSGPQDKSPQEIQHTLEAAVVSVSHAHTSFSYFELGIMIYHSTTKSYLSS